VTEATDENLFERYRGGETACLRTLIERHQAALLGFLFRLTGDRTIAEDAFQDAFLQVHLSAASFDATRRFRPWLFTIAANKARDLMRKKGRRQAVELSAPVNPSRDGAASFIDLMEVDVPQPDAGLDEQERDEAVQRALDRMPDNLREILLLAYFQRLSYQQIAHELDIPLGTVKSRLHSAVANFAARFRADQRASSARSAPPPDSGDERD